MNLNAKIADLTVAEFLKLFDPDMRREVTGAKALADELGVSQTTIERNKSKGVFDGCYSQSITGRTVRYNVALCKERLTLKNTRK